ncbi:hypothetical protein HBH64_186010 [Parastagonospora nodorum]|nr:hypothetical protein HBH53_212520 [Parastagonospora nodorum]KAH3966605.1 hypothetical protein HBH52_198760 [Parastagonospora nodorum]KAH3977872.1 hypothetical protein HBH51_071590 [Parastagonospora nodorum]KAH4044974.1 hypothetical protein HBH49_209800 [Parastagonospora nodorum]KAH4183801.1 hypothetical protein HBH42_199290 [Parastagonospora nodorum]
MFRSPLFSWSPRPGQDQSQDPFGTPATQAPSRFSALHSNIRTMINGSSIYSQSPAIPSNNNTPKVPFRGFFRRDQPDQDSSQFAHDGPRGSHDSRSPLHAQHTAGSYIGAIEPQAPETVYHRHPADVPLPPQGSNYVDPESQQLAEEVNGRRHRRKHRRRKPRQPHADRWVRRRDEPGSQGPMLFVRGSPARGKMIACIISGSMLLTVLSIYLTIALTNRDIGQEIHILFIMVLLTITIFFCHSLIRLCMLILNPQSAESRPSLPDMTSAEGFQPVRPIRVHLARDEEAGNDMERAVESELDLEKDELPPPPPPAYGLWRSSVRVDPNLLHWQRVEGQDNRRSVATDFTNSRAGSAIAAQPATAEPRPPSYVSEDGVSYITEAAPRSTVRQSHSGVSDIHPAWRPGYAVSDVTVWPAGRV